MIVAVLVAAGACDAGGERSAGPEPPSVGSGSANDCRRPDRYPRPWPQRPRYRMRVAVRPDRDVVDGVTRVRFTPDLATNELVFRLWPNAPALASRGADLSVGAVRASDGVLETRSPDPTTLEALLDERLEPGDSVVVRLPWRLRLPEPSLERISRRGDAVHLGSFFPLLAWEPGIGWARDPATNVLGETAVSPVAAFTVKVVARRGLDVLASGSETRPGIWRAPSMRDFALAVGHFDEATTTAHAPDEVDVTVGVTEGLEVSAKRFAAKATQALESFARRFGPYPWSSFNLAVMPDLGGSGIEYPAMVFQGDDSLGFATTHEVAHMWFYALVGSNPARHPWLDEGLATWSHGTSEPDVLDRFLNLSIPDDVRNRIGRPMTFWERHEESYFEGVYAQPVQALDELGPTRELDCAIREYVRRFAHRIATPDDLIRILADHFPAARQTLARYGV